MLDVLRHTVMITGFVFVMMLVIEYVNVLTSGAWQCRLAEHLWGQYLLAAALGAVPGCLGAFAVVAMYSHRILSLGAVVAAMVATMGDESFVLLALVPRKGLLAIVLLFALGVAGGALIDLLARRFKHAERLVCEDLEVHEEFRGSYFPRGKILRQWRECIAARGILAVVLILLIVGIISGQIGHHGLARLGAVHEAGEGVHLHGAGSVPGGWNWVRITMLGTAIVALFIVSTVHDHFLEEHLWRHIARKHLPRVFLWTLGALIVIYMLTTGMDLDIEITARESRWIVLVVAALVGLIPQSGPHLIFVTLFAAGVLPVSILLANSIVQDGHGLLPLLAHSRGSFFVVKVIKFVIGIAVGAVLIASGY